MSGSGPEPRLQRLGLRELLQSLVGFSIAILLLVFGLPRVTGTTWPQIGDQLQMVGPWPALLMLALLLAGLYCYTFTLIASLPGLSHLRALMVNAAGSMVGNILPGGGAVGVALTYVMFRSWGFSRRNISTSIVVTSVWNVLARLTLPVLGALVIVLGPVDAPESVVLAAVIASGLGLLLIGFFIGVLFSDRFAADAIDVVGRATRPLSRRIKRLANLPELLADQRSRTEVVVRDGWLRLTLGLAGMFGLFFVLYIVSARTVGLDLAVAQLFAAYTFRQLLTVVAITPGGLGVTEVGTAGVLVAFGGDPTAASAAALLYAVFTHLLEVPLGLMAFSGWWFGPKTRAARHQLQDDLNDEPSAG